ncbi:MAG: HDOD domain-containing protein [Desulfobacteraceae bacterium]|jgi:putative nucleotidyltransferase with HDIG domain
MDRSQIVAKIENVKNLPTLPSIALAVNKLLKDYDSPMEDLVALLEKDQSLVMKILRLVNSSFFGFKSKVKSVAHAVTLLGYNTVQNAVITVSVIEALTLKNKIENFEIDDFWKHSISVAAMSKFIAMHTKLSPPEDAFTSGLLHDIGKIIWANFFPDELVRILQEIEKNHVTFCKAEKALDLPTHSMLGSVLAKRWMLPAAMVESIKYHHSRKNGMSNGHLKDVVRMSDRIVHMAEGDNGHHLELESFESNVQDSAVKFFRKNPDWLKTISSEMTKACEFLKQE